MEAFTTELEIKNIVLEFLHTVAFTTGSQNLKIKFDCPARFHRHIHISTKVPDYHVCQCKNFKMYKHFLESYLH